MKFTKEQRKGAYKNLNQETQDFIMSSETTELISSLLDEERFSDEQSESADTEILNAMYGLQTLDQAIEEISKATNKQNLSKLKSDLQGKIFDEISKLKSFPSESTISEEQTPLAPTVIVENHSDLPMIITGERPKTALTFEERKKLVPNIPDNKSHYEGGVDPYREQF